MLRASLPVRNPAVRSGETSGLQKTQRTQRKKSLLCQRSLSALKNRPGLLRAPSPAPTPSSRCLSLGPAGSCVLQHRCSRMANDGLQMLGFTLAFIGWIGIMVSTAMPQWKIASYASDNIVTAQAIYEGLWMSCATQSTGQMQCKFFDSLLKLQGSLQGTRALMVSSILLGLIGAVVAMIGMKCMKCMEDDEVKKSRMAILGGVIFFISGLAALVATSWYGNLITQDFFNPYIPVNAKFEFGQALFIGWAASSLSILGGAFLCCACPRRETSYPQTRAYPKSVPSTGKDYV